MSAPTTVNSDIYVNAHYTLTLTVKDSLGTAINLLTAGVGGIPLAGDDINYIMQTSEYDATDQVYKELSSGIEFTNTGSDGKVDVDYIPGDTSDVEFDGADLVYFHRLVCVVAGLEDVCMIGAATLKQKPTKVVNVTLGGDATGNSPVAAASHQLAYELTAGTLNVS